MRWLKREVWRVGIALAGLLLLLLLMVWVPVSAAHAQKLVMLGTVQATPTVDVTATMTALNEEKLRQEIQQLKNQNGNQNNWLVNNSTALIAAVATVIVALFGILQWAITVRQAKDKELRDREDERQKETAARDKELKDRQAAHDKDLRAQAEERFKAAVTALGFLDTFGVRSL
jgi:flagellar biosynthesis/type III secretory pathway M-ring protein FliF/YscJ